MNILLKFSLPIILEFNEKVISFYLKKDYFLAVMYLIKEHYIYLEKK